jgi:hypothetical protein
MRKFAQGTKVQVGKSRGEIDKLLALPGGEK